MGLTKDQEKVQNIRNKNMLVSAAAGSGKTFVLVKRIISMILNDKVDVDQILVVTFTTAAAAEMKERIRQAIDQVVAAGDATAFVRRQATLVHNAQIRTIDSFCSWVVKNYFYEIDQDPSFRTDTKGELKVIGEEILDDLIAERLEAKDPDFINLVDAYMEKNKLDKLKEKVFALYNKAMSFPWPGEWYDSLLSSYNVSSIEELEHSPLVEAIWGYTNQVLSAAVKDLTAGGAFFDANEPDHPNRTFLAEDLSISVALQEAKSYTDRYLICSNMSFSRWSTKKYKEIAPEEAAHIKEVRDKYKGLLQGLASEYYFLDIEGLFDSLKYTGNQARTLIDLTREYSGRLLAEKNKRNLYDFSDIEHMALYILRDQDSPSHDKRPVAQELSGHFRQVMVDEYQDSNQLQEAILTAVSQDNNYFTVGDVKQSIYAFRQVSPDLFREKLDSYPKEDLPDNKSIRVDLDMNFRSRGQVLEFCNRIFKPLMQMDVGKVAYDEDATLKTGALDYPDCGSQFEPEVLVLNADSQAIKEIDSKADALEAAMVAGKIASMKKSGFTVTDKDSDNNPFMREMRYSDVAILLNSTKTDAGAFVDALSAAGIPAFVQEEQGFFDQTEILDLLAMLQVIDNPYNDIPLASVLTSKMFDFSSEKLAQIRAAFPELSFHDCIFNYHQANPDDSQVGHFIELLTLFRDQMVDKTIHEMISLILDSTGYGTYVRALPMGKRAMGNINRLYDEAVAFEATNYRGLSGFVSYINGLKTYNYEVGLAKDFGENDDAVRIMTIHKSKGLEFPIVFLSRTGKSLSSKGEVMDYDEELGLALDYRNPDLKACYKTPFANIVRCKNKISYLGERMRVLYVALTRAKEKLIITGHLKPKKDQSIWDKLEGFKGETGQLGFFSKISSDSFLEWVLRALNAGPEKYSLTVVDCRDFVVDRVTEAVETKTLKESLLLKASQSKPEEGKPIADSLKNDYQGLVENKYHSKYSVSELKHAAMEEQYAEEDGKPLFLNPENQVPDFILQQEHKFDTAFDETKTDKDSKVPAGALYGTAMHRFMECFDFAREDFASSFEKQLAYMKQARLLPESQQKLLNYKKLEKFIATDICFRMHEAALTESLYKEQPFVFSAPVSQLFEGEEGSQEVLIQGIIDVFFKERDGIVLLDYKTDRVDEASELVLRYEKQLLLYRDAIFKAYRVPVKEILIYSFCLDETISLGDL